MERTMSATDVRVRFGEVMRWVVERRKPIIVERGGKPHVVVLSVEEYERLRAGQRERDDWRDLVRQAREQIRIDLGERVLPPPEEIIRQMREERDAQLLALR
jgi:prevent-host-death family protein